MTTRVEKTKEEINKMTKLELLKWAFGDNKKLYKEKDMKTELELKLRKTLKASLDKGFITKSKFKKEIADINEFKIKNNNKKNVSDTRLYTFNDWLIKLN